MPRAPVRPFPAVLLLLASCAADGPAPPERWLGLADVEGRIVRPAGSAAELGVAWTNVDRRRADRTPEAGSVSGFEPDGSFRIADLPYGTYDVTFAWAGGGTRTRRLVVDEPRERLEFVVPGGSLHVDPPAAGELREVRARPFGAPFAAARRAQGLPGGAAKAHQLTPRGGEPQPEPDAPAQAGPGAHLEGLAPGAWVVTTQDDRNGVAHQVVRVDDGPVRIAHAPRADGRLDLLLHGKVPDTAPTTRLLLEAYLRDPAERRFDFGEPLATRTLSEGRNAVPLPAGTWGLLLVARDTLHGTRGILAWLPDVDVPPGGRRELDLELPEARPVLVKAGGAHGRPTNAWSVRLGADLLPASLLLDARDREGERHVVLLPTRDCAVVSGRTRRGAEAAAPEAPVQPGSGVQEVYVAAPGG